MKPITEPQEVADEQTQTGTDHQDNQLSLSDHDKALLTRFNWGAFLLGAWWSLFYCQWIWLAGFFAIGVISNISHGRIVRIACAVAWLVLSWWLGKNANRLSWKRNSIKYDSIENALKPQKIWLIVGLSVTGIELILAAAVTILTGCWLGWLIK